MSDFFDFLSKTLTGLIISFAIAIAIILTTCSIFSHVKNEDDLNFAKAGLQQCIHFNGGTSYTIWQRDCSQK